MGKKALVVIELCVELYSCAITSILLEQHFPFFHPPTRWMETQLHLQLQVRVYEEPGQDFNHSSVSIHEVKPLQHVLIH